MNTIFDKIIYSKEECDLSWGERGIEYKGLDMSILASNDRGSAL